MFLFLKIDLKYKQVLNNKEDLCLKKTTKQKNGLELLNGVSKKLLKRNLKDETLTTSTTRNPRFTHSF